MTSQPIVRAIAVKMCIDALERKLNEAAQYTYGYNGSPAYVCRKMEYFSIKLAGLMRQAQALRKKVPDKFVTERKVKSGKDHTATD